MPNILSLRRLKIISTLLIIAMCSIIIYGGFRQWCTLEIKPSEINLIPTIPLNAIEKLREIRIIKIIEKSDPEDKNLVRYIPWLIIKRNGEARSDASYCTNTYDKGLMTGKLWLKIGGHTVILEKYPLRVIYDPKYRSILMSNLFCIARQMG